MARGNTLKSIALVAGLISVLGVAVYPVIIHPRLYPDKYSMSN